MSLKFMAEENNLAHFQIDKKAMHKVGMVQRVQNEVKIHCQLKHPSILEVSVYIIYFLHFISTLPTSGLRGGWGVTAYIYLTI